MSSSVKIQTKCICEWGIYTDFPPTVIFRKLLTLIRVGFLGVCFVVPLAPPCLTPVKIMLEIWNLVRKYTRIWSWIKNDFLNQGPFNLADVSIFALKNQHLLSKIVPLLKVIVWELRQRFFSSVFSFCKIKDYW